MISKKSALKEEKGRIFRDNQRFRNSKSAHRLVRILRFFSFFIISTFSFETHSLDLQVV